MACHHKSKNQLSISKVLVIPDNKPDIERVIRVVSTPVVRKTSLIKGKVVVTGDINVSVEYVAVSRCNTQPVHFASFKIPFAHFVAHRCARPWQNAKITALIEFQEIQIISRRSINFFVIFLLAIRKLESACLLTLPQEHIPTPCENHNSGCLSVCDDHLSDTSECQSCSCAVCKVDC